MRARPKPKTTAKFIYDYQFSAPNSRLCHRSPTQLSRGSTRTASKGTSRLELIEEGTTLDRKHIVEQGEYERNIVMELSGLMDRMDSSLSWIDGMLEQYSLVQQTQAQKQAYDECVDLLARQFEQQEHKHRENTNLLVRKIQVLNGYRIRTLQEINTLHEANQNLGEEIQRMQGQHKAMGHLKQQEQKLLQHIRQEQETIDRITTKIRLQDDQMEAQAVDIRHLEVQQCRLMELMKRSEQQQLKQQQQGKLQQKYQALLGIICDFQHTLEQEAEQVQPHIVRKVQKLALLHTQISSIDEALLLCQDKISDQNIMIQALRHRSGQPLSSREGLYDQYYRHYSEVYLEGSARADSGGDGSSRQKRRGRMRINTEGNGLQSLMHKINSRNQARTSQRLAIIQQMSQATHKHSSSHERLFIEDAAYHRHNLSHLQRTNRQAGTDSKLPRLSQPQTTTYRK